MKKGILLLSALLILCLAQTAFASGAYRSGDYLGVDGLGTGVVISKNATIRSEPSYNGKSLASVPGGAEIQLLGGKQGSWVNVQYTDKGKRTEGWMLEDYFVADRLVLTLRKSNIPAYCAPTLEAKKVGSLAKMTTLDVIGTWDAFYIVSLRNAAAFIPMDAALWTSAEIKDWMSMTAMGTTTCQTTLRTGPGTDWPEIQTCKANTRLIVSTVHEEGDWYFVLAGDANEPAYVRKSDVSLDKFEYATQNGVSFQ